MLWNDLPPITRAEILSGGTTVSARSLKPFIFRGVPPNGMGGLIICVPSILAQCKPDFRGDTLVP